VQRKQVILEQFSKSQSLMALVKQASVLLLGVSKSKNNNWRNNIQTTEL